MGFILLEVDFSRDSQSRKVLRKAVGGYEAPAAVLVLIQRFSVDYDVYTVMIISPITLLYFYPYCVWANLS
jgi:hypothetical protein